MKKYLLLIFFAFFFQAKGFSQACISMGCASNFGPQNTDGNLPNIFGGPGDCYDLFPYKQVYWQFFYSPSGGIFTQTYTPTGTGDPLDLDYVVFDMGMSGPPTVDCPVDETGWPEVICNYAATYNVATGPGIDGVATTIPGHFYAISIIIWQGISTGGDASYPFTIGNPQIDGIDLSPINCPGVLPVKLTSFDAKVNNCKINLEWLAESEIQFKNYQVEYSTDGRNFHAISTIPTSGSGTNNKYSWSHTDPQSGNAYYRLKMTDINNRIDYSKTIALKIDCKNSSVLLYPNPVADILNVNIINTQNELTNAVLYDNTGKLVFSGTFNSGTNSIDMKKFAKGVYQLRLKNNTEIKNYKVIK